MASIRNLISATKLKIRRSPVDQENCSQMLEEFQKDSSNQIFFRPCTVAEDEDENSNLYLVETPATSKHLLFVFQNKNMQFLYRKYGTNTILLDATYRTCKYALPLYFVVVDTNVNFQVVGVIITQMETKEAISEGLRIFQSFNPDICPKFGMVDFAMEEILSLEEVFCNIQVFICSFHREQAWTRWVSKSKNAQVPRKQCLEMLRKVAYAVSEEELNEAISNLKEWEHYKNSPLKNYFEKTWLPEIKRWALFFKPVEMFLNSNNGVERINKELKYGFLEGFKGCSLSEMISVVLTKFLPERFLTYVRENIKMSTLSRKYTDDLPNFLKERPKWFIDHILSRINAADSIPSSTEVIQKSCCVYEVKTVATSYRVAFELPAKQGSCSCPDFKKERLVCKHIIYVGRKYPEWNIDFIQEWLFDNPIFCLDTDVGICTSMTVDEPATEIASTSTIRSEEIVAYAELPRRGCKKRQMINKMNSTLRSIQSVMWNLDEDGLQEGCDILDEALKVLTAKVTSDKDNGLPMPPQHSSKDRLNITTSNNNTKISNRDNYGKLALHRKRGQNCRVGLAADLLKEASTLPIIEFPEGSGAKRLKHE
ncbi:uncharacterized protein LOC129003812 isoform X2 [Macrosteles quadrilineatus]|nr:uncharacterized protein LOC129003812 isoform X2 [Macrosteles quadrilineatus]XP_054288109.1 uncharacterized protein LOC129003812 isoform X2 [Macrosteles quadrilineatus]